MKTLNELILLVQNKAKKTVALACPEDEEVIEAVLEARRLKMCNFFLFGDKNKITNLFGTDFNPEGIEIFDVPDRIEACREAVKAVHDRKADVLMKGLVDTAVILKEVLNKEYGLRTDRILSHVMVMELPKFDRLILLSDGAMNIDPTNEQLKQITLNAIEIAHAIGVKVPKVAAISAVEKVNPKMPSTLKCQTLQEEFEKENYQDCLVCGPLAIDLALDPKAAETKKITHPVAGAADILIVPYIEVANALYKGWMFGCDHVKSAGIIVGANSPIVLTSRADRHDTKIYSLALSLLF